MRVGIEQAARLQGNEARLVDTAVAAALLGVGPETLRGWRERGADDDAR